MGIITSYKFITTVLIIPIFRNGSMAPRRWQSSIQRETVTLEKIFVRVEQCGRGCC